MFKLFQSRADVHLKRVSALLREAQLARAEHQAAAEHHDALARMYSQRIVRLQAQFSEASSQAQGDPAKANEQVPVEAEPPVIAAQPLLSSL